MNISIPKPEQVKSVKGNHPNGVKDVSVVIENSRPSMPSMQTLHILYGKQLKVYLAVDCMHSCFVPVVECISSL